MADTGLRSRLLRLLTLTEVTKTEVKGVLGDSDSLKRSLTPIMHRNGHTLNAILAGGQSNAESFFSREPQFCKTSSSKRGMDYTPHTHPENFNKSPLIKAECFRLSVNVSVETYLVECEG